MEEQIAENERRRRQRNEERRNRRPYDRNKRRDGRAPFQKREGAKPAETETKTEAPAQAAAE